jgi:hypothetical protein
MGEAAREVESSSVVHASVAPSRLQMYRARTFALVRPWRVDSLPRAIEYVAERGFIFFWPVKGVDLPSLWTAVAGDRPVAAAHDDPGHVTWGWKDALLDKRQWYYGKLLRRRATLVSLDVLPYFYALSERVGDEDDFLEAYREGKLSWEAKSIAQALLSHGPLHTLELRRKAFLEAKEAKSRFERALADLQRGLWILPVGVARAGAWRYAFIYELFDRWFPDMVERARPLSRALARGALVQRYLRSVGVANPQAIAKLFGWRISDVQRALGLLSEQGAVLPLADGGWATKELFHMGEEAGV